MRRIWIGLVVLMLSIAGATGVLLTRGDNAGTTLASSELVATSDRSNEAAFLAQYNQLRDKSRRAALTSNEAAFLRQYTRLKQGMTPTEVRAAEVRARDAEWNQQRTEAEFLKQYARLSADTAHSRRQ